MKKVFEFVRDNFMSIITVICVLALVCAYVAPFVWGTSTLLWQWAMNPYFD